MDIITFVSIQRYGVLDGGSKYTFSVRVMRILKKQILIQGGPKVGIQYIV